ncbi:MAG: Adenylate cyclase [Ignavibacteriae bacterium]|nr:MAG: Adenylate cyclase [Ignavibacteriota bacterium]
MQKRQKKKTKLFFTKILVCIILTFIILFLTEEAFFAFAPFKRVELATIDYRFRSRGTLPFDPRVVIVEINDESLKSLSEKWPWPRSYYAKLIRNLQMAGAAAIGIDIIMSSEDFYSEKNDAEFKKALKDIPNVALAGKIRIANEKYDLITLNENYGNIFFDVDSAVGIVYLRNDEDGVYRRFNPVVYDRARNRRIPTFSFAVLNKYFALPSLSIPEITTKYFIYHNIKIPTYDEYSALINYYGPSGTFTTVKFVDVIDDKEFQTKEEKETGEEINTFDDPDGGYLYDGTFKDKIVLVGSTNPEDKDLFPIPIPQGKQEGDNLMFGVEIHANIIQSILDRNFLTREPLWLEIITIFGFFTITFFFIQNLKREKIRHHYLIEILAVAVVIAELFLTFALSLYLFQKYNYVTPLTGPFLAIIFGYTGSMIFSYVSERQKRVMIKSMFSQYVNPTVVNELIEDPKKLHLGGERKILTVFFSDIEKFTNIAEKLAPEELVKILNEYFESTTEIILKNSGTLDKYQGDSIMAFFGAPVPLPNHALNACQAAIEMQEFLERQNKIWNETKNFQLFTRIGINTGDMIVGNIGGADRFDYTVIGDSVNLGSRLEATNKFYQTKIILSENTFKFVAAQILARELDLIRVVGKIQPIKIYELLGILGNNIPSETLFLIENFSEGLAFYRKRDWEKALIKFNEVLKLKPDDYPSKIYIERINFLKKQPPPDEWDGIFEMTIK